MFYHLCHDDTRLVVNTPSLRRDVVSSTLSFDASVPLHDAEEILEDDEGERGARMTRPLVKENLARGNVQTIDNCLTNTKCPCVRWRGSGPRDNVSEGQTASEGSAKCPPICKSPEMASIIMDDGCQHGMEFLQIREKEEPTNSNASATQPSGVTTTLKPQERCARRTRISS